MKSHAHRPVVLVAVLTAATAAHAGSACFVDDDAAPGGDGLTWDTAYRFLADALAASQASEIRVAQGVYTPDRTADAPNGTGNRGLAFALADGDAATAGDNSYHVVRALGVGSTA